MPAAFRVLSWCVTAAAYLVLAGQLSWSEVFTAVVLASLAALWSARLRRCSSRTFAVTGQHAGHWARAWIALAPGAWRVGCRLLRVALVGAAPTETSAHRVDFDYGRDADALERGRRTTALLTASLGPASFIVRMRAGRGEVLMHRIVPERAAPDRRWLQ
jgi:hypothetical protein